MVAERCSSLPFRTSCASSGKSSHVVCKATSFGVRQILGSCIGKLALLAASCKAEAVSNATPSSLLNTPLTSVLQVGGGDQLYNDHVFELETMKPWLMIDDPQVGYLCRSIV
jgi:hypothetical protein